MGGLSVCAMANPLLLARRSERQDHRRQQPAPFVFPLSAEHARALLAVQFSQLGSLESILQEHRLCGILSFIAH